ncbi:hypothetical protein E1176_12410 [Fulvivirga sp. RKSG066]|uniref:anti-sigma factor family protein n=1 Tax=Fulvivirga aurantia TaxID=2529383 RepID=UPI0012BC5B65|nr:hypothetical protein [Fulvivirga aurantia]MTI21826.1 hypothetical protein [Fulvivirga aurantia]
MEEITHEKLLDYIDGTLDRHESLQLEEKISKDSSLAQQYQELLQIDSALQHLEIHKPSADMAKRVMVSISNPGIKRSSIYLMIITCLTVICGSYFMAEGMIDLTMLEQISYLSAIESYLPDSINYKLISNSLLFVLTIFGLVIFDKLILRPYFKKRQYAY